MPCHLGHRAETLSTAQHANRAVLARFLFYRAGPGFVLLNSCRARAGPMSTAQTNRTSPAPPRSTPQPPCSLQKFDTRNARGVGYLVWRVEHFLLYPVRDSWITAGRPVLLQFNRPDHAWGCSFKATRVGSGVNKGEATREEEGWSRRAVEARLGKGSWELRWRRELGAGCLADLVVAV